MGETRDSIADIWGERTPFEGTWPARVDERTTDEAGALGPVGCVLCSNGCGLDIGVKDGKIVGVRGRAVDRVNRGRLGPKGLHGWEANAQPRPAHAPARSGAAGRLREATWDEAMGLIVERSKEIIATSTPAGRSASTTRGQLFLEEYYTLGVIGKAGLGHAAHGRQHPALHGHRRGGPEGDVRLRRPARLLRRPRRDRRHPPRRPQHRLAADRALDAHPRPPGRPEPAEARRRSTRGATETAQEADVHLAPRLGTNVAVLNGLLHLIIEAGQIDRDVHRRAHRRLRRSSRETVGSYPPERVEEITGVPGRPAAGGGRDPRRGAGRWSRRSSRASTSRTRRRPRPAR